MSFSMPGGGPRGPQMNVTPLIDVLRVLLVIFMLVVVEKRPTALKAEIPQPAPQTAVNIPPPDAAIVIQVKRTKPEDGILKSKLTTNSSLWIAFASDYAISLPSASNASLLLKPMTIPSFKTSPTSSQSPSLPESSASAC